MKRWGKRFGIFIVLVFALVGLRECFEKSLGKGVGVLEIDGTMWTADEWIEELEEFRKDPNVAAVVVRIQSPGGTVASSQEIYEALLNLQKIKPVIASMGTIAASGGLYVAMGGQEIFAEPGTLTGSIGVRMQHLNLTELFRFTKIEYETIKAGQYKDIASISRPMTGAERALLEEMMREIHDQFKGVVASARKLESAAVNRFADGRIFTGAKAKELGLVDTLGGLQPAVARAAQIAGLKGEPRLIRSEDKTSRWFQSVFGMVKTIWSGPVACYIY